MTLRSSQASAQPVWGRSLPLPMVLLILLIAPRPTGANQRLGGEAPRCAACAESPDQPGCVGTPPSGSACAACSDEPACPATYVPGGGSAISLTEGNLREQASISRLRSGFGATVDFSLTYNSYRKALKTGLGARWTHTYNVFLFRQRGDMFRMDGAGRVTKYTQGPGNTFTAAPGYFETLTENLDGSFTLRQKHGTVFTFALIPQTPFRVKGKVYRLTRVEDRNGNVTTITYTNGDLTGITDTYGRSMTLTYTSRHKLATSTDPLGRTTTYTYDATGRQLTAITDPAGQTTQYTYDRQAHLTEKLDKDGRRFTYTYDGDKPIAIDDGAGSRLFLLTNPVDWATDGAALAFDLLREYVPATTTKIDGRGNLWDYAYDLHGFITAITAPDAATTSYTYDPVTLRVATRTDANGDTTSYQYDAQGNLIQETDALGYVTTYTYEPVFNMMTSRTDANGRTTTFDYDARGNRTRETDPLGATREWTYDAHGNVLSEKDKNGNLTVYEYDAFGNRTKITDAVGNVTTMTYDVVGNLLSRTNARGFTTTYLYDALDRLIEETDALSQVTQIFYDGEGNRTQIVDRNGNATQSQYDLRQRLVQIVDAIGQTTTHTYDGNDNRLSTTDKNGHTTTFAYDVQNRLSQITDALGNVSAMTYDGVGNKLTETDANGHTTTYAYDALDRVIQRTDAEANVTQMVYDIVGLAGCPACTGPTQGSSLVTKQIDAEGKVTYMKYDGLDRPLLHLRKEGDTADLIDGSDAVTGYSYDAQGNRLTLTEPNGNTMTYAYDALNRRITMTNAAGDVAVTTYDPVSNVATVTAPNLNVTTNTYDALDRLTQVDDSVGGVANYTYDAVGNRLSEQDGNGNGTTNTYDAIYRITDVTDALGQSMHYAYDPAGNLLTLTDREGNVTSYAYDDINRRTTMTDALANVTQYQYDAVGNLTRIIDANTHTTDYAYDQINRLLTETYADGGIRTFTYDGVSNLTTRTDQQGQVTTYLYNDLYFLLQRDYPVSADDTMTYDLSGRMLTAERASWLVTFTYDGANRVTQTTQNGQTVGYVYNIPGRTRTVTYPGGRTITEHTDLRTRLDAIDDLGSPPPIASYTYDLGNRVVSRTYRNGTVASYTYNANNWLLTLDHTIGLTRIAGFDHTFDDEGNKRFEEKLHDLGNSEAYQYDTTYRLIDFKVGTLVGSTVPVPTTQTQYALDPVGNWNTKTKDSVPETRTHSVTNEITQIDAVPALSDPNGNTSEDGQYFYAYDEENRLTAVTRKADNRVVGQYQYDALSRRIKKIADPAAISSPVETRYFYDDARIIEEQDGAGVTQATYVYGNYVDEVLTMDRGAQTYYYHQNALWSVAAVTDGAAAVAERYAYDAYGRPTITDGAGAPVPLNAWGTPHSVIRNPYLFTEREMDEETALYFYRARYYDAGKGRFLQRDPSGYVDGFNLYEYARSAPTHWLDPSGREDVNNEKGEKVGTIDKSKTNCIGYACRTGGALDPILEPEGKRTSLEQLFTALGYKCTSGITALGCKDHCKCEDYMMLYVYIDKHEDFKKVKEKFKGKDPFKDPIITSTNELDYHGLRGDGKGGYTYQAHRDDKANEKIQDFTPTVAAPDYFGDDQLLGKYCCCRPPKGK